MSVGGTHKGCPYIAWGTHKGCPYGVVVLQGTHKGCPYVGWGIREGCPYSVADDAQNAVQMVGHHDVLVDLCTREPVRDRAPGALNHLPGFVTMHYACADLSEQVPVTLDADGEVVRARLGVIVAVQTD